jgi:glycosyl transferase family 87
MGWRDYAARYRIDLILFFVSLVAYAISSGSLLAHQSQAPHFVYQADALLHGKLALRVQPPNLNDWVLQEGRWYVSFPPFPAVLMIPFVALFGLSFNDVAFTIVFAALNVALFYRLLRRVQDRPEWEHAAFALIYGFGTLAWSCGIRGEVWFTAETIGVFLTLLYLHASLEARHPVLAGLALGCAAITRTPLAFSAIFFLFEALREKKRSQLIPYLAAILAVAIPMAIANYVRFGSPTEFGHSHLYANRVNAQIQKYGLFHYAFLERNLHAAFTRLPEIQFHPLRIGFNGEGMSLFVTTPLFFYLLWPKEKPRLHRPLWLTVAVVAIPGFFYQNSGWFQFGFRFSLDYTPYLILLLALGGHRFTRLFWACALAGVAVNAWGAAVFHRLY